MVGLIVAGHGHFGTGLASSVEVIAGKPENFQAVDFEASASLDDLTKALQTAMDALKDCEGILFCTDLAGGSPFKTAATLAFGKKNIEVVAGTNLPMLIEISMARNFVNDIHDLANMAITTGKDQVIKFELPKRKEETSEDGI